MARTKRDPLIAAMIAKLPDGGEWPVDRQLSWLNLMAMAFGTVYGGDAAARLVHLPQPSYPTRDDVIAAMPPKLRDVYTKPQFPFYIDLDGNALNKHGKPINAKDVQGELVDLRGMDGDVKTIRWADGTMGLNGADLTIVAA